jgi:hypothetical protein
MNISDGSWTVFNADHFALPMRAGNTYIEGHILTADFEITTSRASPFTIFEREHFINNPGRVP